MSEAPLGLAESALAGTEAWLVGGAIRDELCGLIPAEEALDIDLIVGGEPAVAAEAIRKAAGPGVAAFSLSDEFGGWRVAGRGWQVDCLPFQGEGLEADLLARDLTVNAIARPLAGGEFRDPAGGLGDIESGILRMAAAEAFDRDPLRVLRLARLSTQLGMEAEPATIEAARSAAPGLRSTAQERVFTELSSILTGDDPVRAMAMVDELEAEAVVLPELHALHDVEQTRYHHLDAHGHTLEVVQETIKLEANPGAAAGDRADEVRAVLVEPLADGLTRGEALRWAALLHDIAKSRTRVVSDEGRVGFPGHDGEGSRMAREILGRLRASDRLASYVAAITETHLRLGYLVHSRPIDTGDRFDYLSACDPVEVDVTLLSVADRLATRGRKADEAIAAHLELAVPMMSAALDWRRHGRPRSPIPGDALASELEIEPGPKLGELIAGVERAVYTGEVGSRDEAVEWSREMLAAG